MVTEQDIKRINELYHKSQDVGLTKEELEEQATLRRKYIDSVKNNLTSQLNNMSIKYPDGRIEKVKKKK